MASEHVRWLYNLRGLPEPLVRPGLFQAGATQAIRRGEILEKTNDTNTRWVPIDSDHDASTTKLAIAAENIYSGDLAGYYDIYIPREDDVWEFPYATADDLAVGASLYYSSSEAVTISGTNIIGYVVGQEHYPQQGHASLGEPDAGATLRFTSNVRMVFRRSYSIWSTYVPAS